MDGHGGRVDAALTAAVAAEDELMAQMGGHLIEAGGKRARPLFAVASAAVLATSPEGIDAAVTDDVVLGGVAVELVQVGSLCHDDVIDEAETRRGRSEEHTSELQSLMRISSAVLCLKKKHS